MPDDTYNGWTNYETWAVGMYLDGNYTGAGTHEHVVRSVQEWLADDRQRWSIADGLESIIRDRIEGYEGDHFEGLAADLIGASLSSVNWYELADAWIDNVNEQVEA